jgi:hypothetical protein
VAVLEASMPTAVNMVLTRWISMRGRASAGAVVATTVLSLATLARLTLLRV